MWSSINIQRIHKKNTVFESPDDLIASNYFRVVAIIDSNDLTVIAKTEIFLEKVNADVYLANN